MSYHTEFQWYGTEREQNAQCSDIFLKLETVLVLVLGLPIFHQTFLLLVVELLSYGIGRTHGSMLTEATSTQEPKVTLSLSLTPADTFSFISFKSLSSIRSGAVNLGNMSSTC